MRYSLEEILQAFPCDEAEIEDLIADLGPEPLGTSPIEQTVSWPAALLMIGGTLLCIVLTIGGL